MGPAIGWRVSLPFGRSCLISSALDGQRMRGPMMVTNPLRVDVGIGEVECASLIRPVMAQEVHEAVWALAADKAPGPDGFPPFFFRRYWGIIRPAVVEAIQCFFTQAAMPEDWKATFITLIPKRQDAAEPSQGMMWDLRRASKRHSLMAVKLDMERALRQDQVEFSPAGTGGARFPQAVDWVDYGGVSGGQSSLSWSTGACASRELEAYVPAPGARPISHLLFADDCLLLARARIPEARVLRRVVADYCVASGQRVNFLKSAVFFSPSTETGVRQEIRGILQVPEQEGTLTYLGVPITGRRLRVAECLGLVQQVQSRLEGWRASSLSMMGRVTLVRAVLGSIPVYLMANTVVPKTILLRIERLLRCFLWGSYGGGHGVHLVAWEQVCLPTSEGGLGVQSLIERREALIARHAAQFMLVPHSFWSQVMAARYGQGASAAARTGRRVSFMWREIGRYLPSVAAHTRWLIGDGRSIDVTSDSWVDTLPLSRWPTMVDTEAVEGLRVCDLLAPGGAEWDEARLRLLFGVHLAVRIRSLPLPGCGGPDVRVWGTSSRAGVRLGDLSPRHSARARAGARLRLDLEVRSPPEGSSLFVEGVLGPPSDESSIEQAWLGDPCGVRDVWS
ncbi:uncharacterized protein LOC120104305 [Phoenix dactylifera]|uniref:Uncharacterized protein LOC120104305 n=1 Tax=Phoenix dactylifera TaxID=42345 RepID=A0A8B8ZH81_PHODC|nr:uncharacterized protein LOC120104305 [Phoenix dactylifera]